MRRHVLPTAPSPTTTHLRANCHVSEQENADSSEDGGVQKEEKGHCSFIDRPSLSASRGTMTSWGSTKQRPEMPTSQRCFKERDQKSRPSRGEAAIEER